MLKKLLEPFVWVIGIVASGAYWVFLDLFAFGLYADLSQLEMAIHFNRPWAGSGWEIVLDSGWVALNLVAVLLVVVYFGARGFPVANETLFRSFVWAWALVLVMDITVTNLYVPSVFPRVSDFEMIPFIGVEILALVAGILALVKMRRYFRIVKAAALAGDKKPFAGWNKTPMRIMAGLSAMAAIAVYLWVNHLIRGLQ